MELSIEIRRRGHEICIAGSNRRAACMATALKMGIVQNVKSAVIKSSVYLQLFIRQKQNQMPP